MATFSKFRDPKTGRFVAWNNKKILSKEIFQKTPKGGNRIGARTKKWKFEKTPDRIIITGADGKRKSIKNIRDKLNYEKGVVYKNGVKIFNLSREGFLSKKQVQDIKEFITTEKQKKSVGDFIKEDLYPEKYKRISEGGKFSEENIRFNQNDG